MDKTVIESEADVMADEIIEEAGDLFEQWCAENGVVPIQHKDRQ